MMTASRRFWRPSIAALGVLLAAMLLAGCVDAKLESEFNEDGSAVHAFQATIEREGLEQLESMGGEMTTTFDPEDGREQAEAAGFDFAPIDTDDEVGSRVSKSYDDGENVGAAFDDMLVATADEGTASPVGAVTGTFVKDGDDYRLNLTIDSDILFANSGVAEDSEDVEDLGFGDLDSFIDITYTARMPGEISETNGLDLGDGKVEWELPLTGITEISAVSKEEGAGGVGLIAIAGLVGLLAVGALVGGYLFTRRRTPAAATTGPGVATHNTPPNSQPPGLSYNTAPNLSPSGVTTNMASGAPPSRSMGTNAPPLARADAPSERPTHEQDTTKLP
jgi:hypothetical protein